MKSIDVIAAVLLVVGGLNWGLVGLVNVNLVDAIFGSGTLLSSTIYSLVGAAAVYQGFLWKSIQDRWCDSPTYV